VRRGGIKVRIIPVGKIEKSLEMIGIILAGEIVKCKLTT
jgi:hypothetical protein